MDITNKETNNKSWEDEFWTEYAHEATVTAGGGWWFSTPEAVKQFISQLLQQERKAERERIIDEVIEYLMKENEKLFVKLSMLYKRTKIKDAYNIKDVIKEIIESSKIEAKQDANKELAIWLTNKYKNL